MSAWDHVEGETPIDRSGLRDKSVQTRADLNRVEAENIRKAHLKYFVGRLNARLAPFDFAWFLKVHDEMFGDVWNWAGIPRTTNLNIGVGATHVQTSLYDLVGDLEAWQSSDMDIVEQAARLHHRAVEIHPFLNGNGRWSRMIANIWLRLKQHPIVEWPEATIGEASVIRREYIEALKSADRFDFAPLIKIHRRHIASQSDG
jgi:Fic-DOC domain mobile mystery protein B